ncbi:MAG TPA: hypothetical protein VNX61_05135 [Rhizomicrobium sp.]|nr:hypothetical protein [Rhizomicrobium sp.]
MVLALAEGGRHVSLEELAAWRKDGLLPPLASHGVRTSGRCYYWREPDILAHAETVHDLLRKHGRREAATIGLWLRGFEIPLPQLRRAWLHRSRGAGRTRIRRVSGRNHAFQPLRGLSGLMLCAAACATDSIENSPASTKTTLAVLQRASAALGQVSENQNETEALWRIAMALLPVLASSDVVSAASEGELRQAQRHLGAAFEFLSNFRGNEPMDAVIDSLGPPIFLFVMTLLRSGQHSLLETVMNRIGAARYAMTLPRKNGPHALVAEQAVLP